MWHVLQVYRSWFTITSSQWTPGECSAHVACTSVINNCCSGPALGQTDLAFPPTALPVVLLRNYLRFNSPVCNKGRKESTETHTAQEQDVGFIKISVSLAAKAITFAWVLLVKLRVYTKNKIAYFLLFSPLYRCLFFSSNSPGNL